MSVTAASWCLMEHSYQPGFNLRKATANLVAVAAPLLLALCLPRLAHALLNSNENALDVLGQFAALSDTTPSYTKSCANNGASQIGLARPTATAIDTVNHRLFVA